MSASSAPTLAEQNTTSTSDLRETVISQSSTTAQGEQAAIPSSRRQSEFHAIFKSIPVDEQLVESYSCALNREILIHGRMYVGEQHVCFHANVLGWITNVVISLKDVVAVEKRLTAFVIPNAIQISTLHQRYFFASFMFREDAYNHLIRAWRRVVPMGMAAGSGFYQLGRPFKLGEDIFADDIPFDAIASSINDSGLPGETDLMGGISSREGEGAPQHSPPHHHPRQHSYPSSSPRQQPHLTLGDARFGERYACGCEHHFPLCWLSRKIPLPLTTLHTMLFDPHSDFMGKFYHSICYDNCTIDEAQWRTAVNGTEQRSYTAQIPLPRIIPTSQKALGNFKEIYLLKHPARRYIIETTLELTKVPGGTCMIRSRTCLARLDESSTLLVVSGETYPPRGSWFKESIRQSLATQMSDMHSHLERALIKSCPQGGSPPGTDISELMATGQTDGPSSSPSRRLLTWWASNDPLTWRRHRRVSSTNIQIYFDWTSFKWSLFWLTPLLVLLIAWLYHRHHQHIFDPHTDHNVPPDLSAEERAERIRRLRVLQDDLGEFIKRQRHSLEASPAWSTVLDGVVERVGRLEEHLLVSEEQAVADSNAMRPARKSDK